MPTFHRVVSCCGAAALALVAPTVGRGAERAEEPGSCSEAPAAAASGEGSGCTSNDDQRAAQTTLTPALVRSRLLARLAMSGACLPPNMTDAQLAALFEHWNELPESVTGPRGQAGGFAPRFNVAATTLVGNGALGPSGQSASAALTYSFPPENLVWGSGVGAEGPNSLYAAQAGLWGTNGTDNGRELIRQGLASWRKWCGVTYTEVTDDGRPYDTVTGRRAGVGDVRIGAALVNSPNFIAYNNFPASGSDMFIDTSYYNINSLNNPANQYRNLRNVVAHEHGHGTGMIHQVPCNTTKLMEPFASGAFDGLQVDDIRGGQLNFGDRFSGNQTPATAKDFGDVTAGPTGRSIRQLMLSTNGMLTPTNPQGADWFKISSSVTGRLLIVRVKPKGGSYATGPQMALPMNVCAGASSTVAAGQAGNLRLDFYTDPNAAPTFSSSAGGPGVDETVGLTLGTGTRYIRVSDDGPNAAADQVVQLYDLEILVNNQPSEPVAIFGINKLARVGELCVLTPGVNSQATEPGATISSFQYDLDGDGIFESSGTTGSTVFNTPGLRNCTVRVIDSNGKSADDTITVNVLSNDACADAPQVLPNTPLVGSTVGATASGDAVHACGSGVSDAGVWYRFVPLATAVHSISTCPNAIDTVLSVYSGSCGSLISIGCNDDDETSCASAHASRIPSVTLTAGVPYMIKVSGFLNTSGQFTLNVNQASALGSCCGTTGYCVQADQASCVGVWASGGACSSGGACVPGNDACASPAILTLNTTTLGTTTLVPNSDPDNIYGCQFGQGRGVWFNFTAGKSTRYQISSCGSSFNTLLHMFLSTNCAIANVVACNYASNSNRPCANDGLNARIPSVQMTAGTTYRILLSGVSFGTTYDGGKYQLVVRCVADFNESGTISVQDIFDFLAAYFSQSLAADANGSGTVTVQDIFDFLTAYFVGCS